MKRLIITLLFCLPMALSPAFGQPLRYWTDGPLTWEDFSRVDTAGCRPFLSVSWKEQKVLLKEGKTHYEYYRIQTLVNPKSSLVSVEWMTPDELRKQQELFNLTEWFGRSLRDTLLVPSRPMRDYIREFTVRRKQEGERLLKGSIPPVSLAQPDPFDIRQVPFRRFRMGIGASFDAGISFPLSDMVNLTMPLVTVAPSVELGWDRFFLGVGMMYGLGRCRESYVGVRGVGKNGDKVRRLGGGVYPGCRILNGRDWIVSIFGGPGVTAYYFSSGPVTGACFTEGVRLEYRLHEHLRFGPRPGAFLYGLRLAFFADQLWSPARHSFIPSVNVSLGIKVTGYGIQLL